MNNPLESDENVETIDPENDENAIHCTILEDNSFTDRERFDQDGWVYDKDGNRLRKWFITFERDYRLWEPKLKDIVTLEAKRYKVRIRCNKRLKQLWKELIDILPESAKESKTPIFGQRFVSKENKTYWMSVNYDPEHKSLGFDWIRKDENNPDGVPQTPFFLIDQNVIDAYWHYEYNSRSTSTRARLFDEAFLRAVYDKLINDGTYNALRDRYNAVKLVVNGREYWFSSDRSSYGNGLQCISTPEKTLIVKID